MLGLEVAILSETGGRRVNEDACGHWHSERQLCCVLADGAGGHGGGDIASRTTVEHVIGRFALKPTEQGAALADLLLQANAALRERQQIGTPSADMRSTVVCLVIDFVEHRAHWAHAGDSRLYWFRGGALLQRTVDHSLVQHLIDAGIVPADGLRSHPRRSELHSALGGAAQDLTISASEPPAAELQAGDVFLLCTDGLWEHVDEALMEADLQAAARPQDWLSALERRVLAATQERSGHDNFTALTVWLSAV